MESNKMKDFYVLFYDPLETSVMQISNIIESFQKMEQMEDKSMVALPYEVSLRKLDKDELKYLLKIYEEFTKVLLNE